MQGSVLLGVDWNCYQHSMKSVVNAGFWTSCQEKVSVVTMLKFILVNHLAQCARYTQTTTNSYILKGIQELFGCPLLWKLFAITT